MVILHPGLYHTYPATSGSSYGDSTPLKMSETAQSVTKAAETASAAPQDTKDPQVDFTTGDDERDPEEVSVAAELACCNVTTGLRSSF
jgi:hypothetical protein